MNNFNTKITNTTRETLTTSQVVARAHSRFKEEVSIHECGPVLEDVAEHFLGDSSVGVGLAVTGILQGVEVFEDVAAGLVGGELLAEDVGVVLGVEEFKNVSETNCISSMEALDGGGDELEGKDDDSTTALIHVSTNASDELDKVDLTGASRVEVSKQDLNLVVGELCDSVRLETLLEFGKVEGGDTVEASDTLEAAAEARVAKGGNDADIGGASEGNRCGRSDGAEDGNGGHVTICTLTETRC